MASYNKNNGHNPRISEVAKKTNLWYYLYKWSTYIPHRASIETAAYVRPFETNKPLGQHVVKAASLGIIECNPTPQGVLGGSGSILYLMELQST